MVAKWKWRTFSTRRLFRLHPFVCVSQLRSWRQDCYWGKDAIHHFASLFLSIIISWLASEGKWSSRKWMQLELLHRVLVWHGKKVCKKHVFEQAHHQILSLPHRPWTHITSVLFIISAFWTRQSRKTTLLSPRTYSSIFPALLLLIISDPILHIIENYCNRKTLSFSRLVVAETEGRNEEIRANTALHLHKRERERKPTNHSHISVKEQNPIFLSIYFANISISTLFIPPSFRSEIQ